MKKEISVWHVAALAVLALMTTISTCGSCGTKRAAKEASAKADSLTERIAGMEGLLRGLPDRTDLRIEGLRTEKRVLINTNTIFLTRERPDWRYSAIDAEIDSLEATRKRNK